MKITCPSPEVRGNIGDELTDIKPLVSSSAFSGSDGIGIHRTGSGEDEWQIKHLVKDGFYTPLSRRKQRLARMALGSILRKIDAAVQDMDSSHVWMKNETLLDQPSWRVNADILSGDSGTYVRNRAHHQKIRKFPVRSTVEAVEVITNRHMLVAYSEHDPVWAIGRLELPEDTPVSEMGEFIDFETSRSVGAGDMSLERYEPGDLVLVSGLNIRRDRTSVGMAATRIVLMSDLD